MAASNPTRIFSTIGVVEGFYGRVWDPSEREAFIDGLAPFGLNTYLFAPKHEPAIGKSLLEPLTRQGNDALRSLVAVCSRHGILPMAGLHLEPPFDPAVKEHLERLVNKALQLSEMGFGGFGVLFDDVPSVRSPFSRGGADPFAGSLATAQAHAFTTLHAALEERGVKASWLICPGRYSLDPLVEKNSGTFEPDYLRRLHEGTPPEVPWLWTGPRVCSSTITLGDREEYLAEAGPGGASRPLVLWDNYPVNDARMAGRLHLDPLGGRARDLAPAMQGYLFNPLLLPHLGMLPGATCLLYAKDPAGYDPTQAWQEALNRLYPPELHMPLRELAALTRSGETAGALPPAWPRGSFPLADRLARAWNAMGGAQSAAGSRGSFSQAGRMARASSAMGEEAPIEPYVAVDLRRVLDTLEGTLPPASRAEAAPWLTRLRTALRLFETAVDGAPLEAVGPLRAQYVAPYIAGPIPEVLGDWFP